MTKQAISADFPQRLADLRRQHSLTQAQLAERIGMHVVQLPRYEAGTSQPTLDVIRKLATALQVSADMLLFGKDERGPDEDLRLQFEAVSRLDEEEKRVVRSLSGRHDPEARSPPLADRFQWKGKQVTMAFDLQQQRQEVHSLVDLLPPAKLGALRNLLEIMVDDEEEKLTEEDRRALRASDKYFRNGGEGVPFEQVVTDLGFTMDQVRGAKKER